MVVVTAFIRYYGCPLLSTVAVKRGTKKGERKKEAKGDKRLYHTANRAPTIFILGKESGDTFCKAADMQLKMNEKDEAANTFINASKSYKKSSPQGIQRLFVRLSFSLCLIELTWLYEIGLQDF